MQEYQEGQTATHKDGRKIVYTNGQWRLQKGASAPTTGGMGAKAKENAYNRVTGVRNLMRQLDRVEELYKANLKGAGIVKSLGEYMPSQANSQFDGAVSQLGQMARAAFRIPGSGQDTEKELALILGMLPNRWSFDGKNEENLSNLRRTLMSLDAQYAPVAGVKALGAKQLPGSRGPTATINIDGN